MASTLDDAKIDIVTILLCLPGTVTSQRTTSGRCRWPRSRT